MTTATVPARKNGKAARPAPARAAKRKLRIRNEFLPKSARYAEMDGQEYVCIPVKDFGGWYEEIEDRVAVEEFEKKDDGVRIPLEEVMAELELRKSCPLCEKHGRVPNRKTAKILDEATAGKNLVRTTMEELRQIWNNA